jgi:hypothetical protein
LHLLGGEALCGLYVTEPNHLTGSKDEKRQKLGPQGASPILSVNLGAFAALFQQKSLRFSPSAVF